jgi:hypothetical protein
MDEKVAMLKNLVEIQLKSSHVSEYMRGMANGLIVAEAVFTGKMRPLLEPPDEE